MTPEELRKKALEKANELEKNARENNRNCLLLQEYQNCINAIKEVDYCLTGRTDAAANKRVKEILKSLNIEGE